MNDFALPIYHPAYDSWLNRRIEVVYERPTHIGPWIVRKTNSHTISPPACLSRPQAPPRRHSLAETLRQIDQQCSYIQWITSEEGQTELRRRHSDPLPFRYATGRLSKVHQALQEAREFFDDVKYHHDVGGKLPSGGVEMTGVELETTAEPYEVHHFEKYWEHVVECEKEVDAAYAHLVG